MLTFGWKSLSACVNAVGTEFPNWYAARERTGRNPPPHEAIVAQSRIVVSRMFPECTAANYAVIRCDTFGDPAHVPGRRDHLGFNIELLIGVFGNPYPVDHRNLCDVLTQLAAIWGAADMSSHAGPFYIAL